ncbi:MAG TPA: DUF1707 domain-containing protein [Streptosporangiaceae bacterium]
MADGLRVSDADRDAVVSELSEHFQAGRLDQAEFDDRTGRALRARTESDLDPLLADLPPRAAAQAGSQLPPAVRGPLPRILLPVLVAAVLVTAAVVGGGFGGWHHHWGYGVFFWWLIPLLAFRLLWWRRGGARRWQ